MINRTSPGDQRAIEAAGKRRWVDCAVLGGVCALVIGVYMASAHSGLFELSGSKPADSYYNLLVQGFRAGQLDLKTEVPQGLMRLADPYEPDANVAYRLRAGHPLWDTSYYKGKLYLYFGVTPALVLFWPHAALTGRYLLHKDAVVIFCAMGFLTSAGLLWALWRRYFGEISVGVVAAGTVALGLATGLPVFLQRCDVHEVAISCGYALVMLALAALWRALHEPQRRGWWLAAASLAYGLVLGARPSLLFGAVSLLVPVFQAWRGEAGRASERRFWSLALAAVAPILFVGLGLMFYNALRFDSPFDFGGRYQLGGARQDTMQHFSLRYLGFNLRMYFLEPARWRGRFPFIQENVIGSLPRGHHGGVEHTFGVLTNTPLVWLALATPLAWRNRSAEVRCRLRWLSGAVALFLGASVLTLGLFTFAYLRYEVEFLPELMLLAMIGLLGLERTLAGQCVWRGVVRWGWGFLLVCSVVFNFLASFNRQGEFHYGLGFASLQKGQLDKAVVEFQKALEAAPNNVMTRANLGLAYFRKGQVDEAIVQFQRALEIQPDFADARSSLCSALVAKGRLDEAIARLQTVLATHPNNAEVHNDLGDAFFRKGQVDDAIVEFQRALKIQPEFAMAHYNLGAALLRNGRLDEGITHLQKGVQLQPGDAEAHYDLGLALVQRRRLDEAVAQFQQALEIRPSFAQAHNNLGAALLHKGRAGEATVHFQKALEIEPGYAMAHYNLGTILLQKGRLAEAVVHFKKTLEIEPRNTAARNDLAWVLATSVEASIRDGARAIALAQEANQLSGGDNPALLRTLAAAYAEAGQFAEAVTTARQAAQLATAQTNTDLVNDLQAQIKLYQAGSPFRDSGLKNVPVSTGQPASDP